MASMEGFEKALQFRSARSQAAVLVVASRLWRLVTVKSPSVASEPGITPLVLCRQQSGQSVLERFHELVRKVAAAVVPCNRRAMIDLFALMAPALEQGIATARTATCSAMLSEISASIGHSQPYDNAIDLVSEKVSAIKLLHSLAHHAINVLRACLQQDRALLERILSALHASTRNDVEQVHSAALLCASRIPLFGRHADVVSVFPDLLASWSDATKGASKLVAWASLRHFAANCVSQNVDPMALSKTDPPKHAQQVLDSIFCCIRASLLPKYKNYAPAALSCVSELLVCVAGFCQTQPPHVKLKDDLQATRVLLEQFLETHRRRVFAGMSTAVECLRVTLQLQLQVSVATNSGSERSGKVLMPPQHVFDCASFNDAGLSVAVLRLAAFVAREIADTTDVVDGVLVRIANCEFAPAAKLMAALKEILVSVGQRRGDGQCQALLVAASHLSQLLLDRCGAEAGPCSGKETKSLLTAVTLSPAQRLKAELLGTVVAAAADEKLASGVFACVSDETAPPLQRAAFACALGAIGRDRPKLISPAWQTCLLRSLQRGDAPQLVADTFSIALGRLLSRDIAACISLLDSAGPHAQATGEPSAWQISVLAETVESANWQDVEAHAAFFASKLVGLVNIHDDSILRKITQSLGRMVFMSPSGMAKHLQVSTSPPRTATSDGGLAAVSAAQASHAIVVMGALRYSLSARSTVAGGFNHGAGSGPITDAPCASGGGGEHGGAGLSAGHENRESIHRLCGAQIVNALTCTCPEEPLMTLKLYSFAVEALGVALDIDVTRFATVLLPLLRPSSSAAGALLTQHESFDLWPCLLRMVLPDHRWQSTVVIGKMKKKKDLGEPLRVAIWSFLSALVAQFPQLLTTAKLVPYAAWGLKDSQMDVRVAAGDFLLTVARVNPFVLDSEATMAITLAETTERKTSQVTETLLGRLVKMINRNRTDERGDSLERKACQRIAAVAFALAQRTALRSNSDFADAVSYIQAGVKASKGGGNPALLKMFWDQLQE
eukprot:INCI12582.1.p1 GENE.INCI12582.1~~INCI12582.1.p1  ORF type:complete len:1092 (-),score=185.55 INCI12582.1:270-3302(-)